MDSVSKVELSSKVTVVVRNGLVSIVAVVAAIGAFASVDPLVNPEMGWPLKDLATLGTVPVVLLPLIVVLNNHDITLLITCERLTLSLM